METDGIVLRVVHHQVPPKVEYLGWDLGHAAQPSHAIGHAFGAVAAVGERRARLANLLARRIAAPRAAAARAATATARESAIAIVGAREAPVHEPRIHEIVTCRAHACQPRRRELSLAEDRQENEQ